MSCPVREKLVLLEPVELKEHRDPVVRLVPQDLLDLLEHRFVYFDLLQSYYSFVSFKLVFIVISFFSVGSQFSLVSASFHFSVVFLF